MRIRENMPRRLLWCMVFGYQNSARGNWVRVARGFACLKSVHAWRSCKHKHALLNGKGGGCM